jgi:hypothetical protein
VAQRATQVAEQANLDHLENLGEAVDRDGASNLAVEILLDLERRGFVFFGFVNPSLCTPSAPTRHISGGRTVT